MTKDEEDRIRRAEEIQRYTENRCEALEKENARLSKMLEMAMEDALSQSHYAEMQRKYIRFKL